MLNNSKFQLTKHSSSIQSTRAYLRSRSQNKLFPHNYIVILESSYHFRNTRPFIKQSRTLSAFFWYPEWPDQVWTDLSTWQAAHSLDGQYVQFRCRPCGPGRRAYAQGEDRPSSETGRTQIRLAFFLNSRLFKEVAHGLAGGKSRKGTGDPPHCDWSRLSGVPFQRWNAARNIVIENPQ